MEIVMAKFALRWQAAALIALGTWGIALSSGAEAAGPFAPLNGTWSGAGQIKLNDGRTESLKCKAYYVPRGGGAAIGLSLRCASASNKIELRSSLTSSGGAVTGSWEERTFNASGDVSGQVSGNRLRLSINGGGLSGSMTVTMGEKSQSISVSTQGVALRGVNISLRRD
jgi:hypothetical protein